MCGIAIIVLLDHDPRVWVETTRTSYPLSVKKFWSHHLVFGSLVSLTCLKSLDKGTDCV